MNEDFVSFELAVKLKKKGFNKGCIKFYDCNKQLQWSNSPWLELDYNGSYRNIISAPTILQVLKWLRTEKEIDVVIYPIDACTVFMGGEKYILSVYISRKRDYKLHHDNKDKYVEWEDAALAGIEYVLNNLI